MPMNLQEARQKIPELAGLDDARAFNIIHSAYYPDMDRAALAKALNYAPDAPKAASRTWGDAVTDTGRGLASGVGGLVKGAGTLYGLTTGNMENGATELGDSVQQYWENGQSQQLKDKRTARQASIDATDGTLSKAYTAVKETLTDPALAMDTVATNAATMLPGMAVGRLAAGAKAAQGLSAASKFGPASVAAREAALKAAGSLGTKVAIGAGALQQGADVSQSVYEDAMKKSNEAWAQNPDFMAAFAKTDGSEKALHDTKHDFALMAARVTMPAATAISVGANMIPGADMLERALVGGGSKVAGKGGIAAVAKSMGKSALGEAAQETLEEGGGAFAGNVAQQRFTDQNQDLMEKVGENAGMGAAGGLLMGAGGGAFHGRAKKDTLDPSAAAAKLLADQQEVARKAAVGAVHAAAATPNSPIARAAAAANPLTPEEAWAKAQELDAQAELDEANGVEQVGPPAEPPAQQDGAMDALVAHQNADPTIQESLQVQPASAFDAQAAQEQYRADTLAAQKAQDDELNAQAEAALAKMDQRKQQTRPVNEVVSDGGYLYEGTQDGDVLNGLGKPFSIKMGALQEAKRQARENGGDWTVAPVFDGFVARKKATSQATEPVESAQAATENVANNVVSIVQKLDAKVRDSAMDKAVRQEIASQLGELNQLGQQNRVTAGDLVRLQEIAGTNDNGYNASRDLHGLLQSIRTRAAGTIQMQTPVNMGGHVPAANDPASHAVASEIDKAAHEAATSPLNDKPQPTDGQKEAGNYAKGHITVHGMDMAIENPKGSTRSGVSPDGTAWSNTMGGHYGYFKGTLGNDGDHVDGYVGPNPESNRVFVIDQVNKDGSFDEHKAMIGYDSPEQAREAYMSSFMPGWTGLGAMTELPVSAFKSWVADGVKKKPLGDISRPQPAEPVSQPQEQPSAQTAEAQQTEPQQQAATGSESANATEPDQPAAEQAGAGKAEVDLTTVEGVARAVQMKVAANRRKSREKSRREREKQGFSPNSTPESEQADYEAEISGSPSELQKKSAAAMLGTDPVPLIGMFVNGNFEASEDVFKDIKGVKIRGLSAKDKKAALYQWAKWTPEQIAQAEGESQARAEAAADKRMQDDFNSAVTGAWLGLDRLKVNLKSGDTITGQDFILQSVAGGFDKAHSQKKGAAVIYGLTDGSRFTTLKAQEFTKFVKAAIAFGGLDKALAYVNPPEPQAPEGFVDRSIDTADSRKADPAPVEQAPQAEPAAPAPEADTLGGFDPVAFDKERDDRIKASREAGNVHLDKVPPYVESMRGKQIYYAHDPKITGTIRTVDNRGTVYVNWNDAYSAEKELASPTQDGKKTVMQSGLGTSDLKDYVVGKPMAPAAEGSAPSKEPAPRPKNWDKNYGAASKIAEALGIALRGANGKMKKVPELVADIKALDVGGKPSPDGDGQHDELDSEMRAYEERATRIESTLANGGHVVGDQLRSNNGMGLMKLTPAELTRIPANKVREKPDPEKARVDTVKNQPKIDTSAEPVQKPAESGQVDAPQIEWTRTRNVDRMGIALKAGFKESVAESLSKRSWSSLDVVVQEKLAEAMAEPQEKPSEPPPAPTGEDALYTSTAKLTQPYTMDDFIGNVDAGYRAHFDYAGADGRTLWIEHLADGGWVLKSKDDDSASTYTKGGVGYGGRWSKAQAMREAENDAKYRYTEWKPVAGVMFQSSGEKAAITAGFKYLTNDHTWVKTVAAGEKRSELFNIREFGPENDRSYRVTKATSFPGTGATGAPSVDLGTFKTLDVAVEAAEKAQTTPTNKAGATSSSPAIQDFLDGKRDDAPTIEEVKAEASPLVQAMNFLMELQAKQDANGRIGDDRLETMIRQQKAVVKELQDAANKPADTPSQEPSNTVKSPAIEAEPIDPEDRAVLDAAKAKIEELDSKIERHEALLNCLK